ncbi:MAG: hypothetical protein HOA30_01680 [Rhodospirillaceae bacterium]|nr:hypothetical protein [Rhodospirillaceae bacterium]
MNPEFRRLLLTEFQGYRLIALPVSLGAIFGLTYYLNDFAFDSGSSFVATAGYFALVFIWGTRQAADSVLQEINHKTWVPQRMSSMSAWGMGWAKLAGSTAFTWIGGFICLGVFAASNTEWWSTQRLIMSVALYAGTGLLAQTICFLVSLSAIQKRREFGRVHVVSYQFLGMICALPPLYIGLSVTGGEGILDLITWHGEYLSLPQFMAIFTAAFIGWGLAGIWALMRAELQEPVDPWLWAAFVVFAMVFFGGLRSLPVGPNTPIAFYDFPSIPTMVLIAGVFLIYLIGVTEGKNCIQLRRLDGAISGRQWRTAWMTMPRSIITVPLVGLGVWIAASNFSEYTVLRGQDLHLIYGATILFALRDLGFIYFICLGRRDGRGEGIALIALALLYILVPETIGVETLDQVIPLFSPYGENPSWWTVIAPMLEIGIIGALLARRWRRVIRGPVDAGDSSPPATGNATEQT